MLKFKNNKHNTYNRCTYLYIVNAVIFKLLLTSYLKRDLANKKKYYNNITTLLYLAISVCAKVLLARGEVILKHRLSCSPITTHWDSWPITTHFVFRESGPSSNQELIEQFVSGWGERYCKNVNYVKNNAIFKPPLLRACSSTPPKQNQNFVKEHNRTPLTYLITYHSRITDIKNKNLEYYLCTLHIS